MELRKRIEEMKSLAIEKGYEIKESDTPAYHFIEAVKDNIKIHIATLSNSENKLNPMKDFLKSLDDPEEWEIQNEYIPDFLK